MQAQAIKSDLLGLRLIASLLKEQELVKVIDVLKETDLDGDARSTFRYIREYVSTRGMWPGRETVEAECVVSIPAPNNALDDMIELVRKRSVKRFVVSEGAAINDLLQGNNPDAALSRLKSVSDRVSIRTTTDTISLKNSRDDRYEDYLRRKSLDNGFSGFLTPWTQLNDRIQGYVDSEYVIMAAKTNTGKSWACVLNANTCLNQVGRILLVSMEMPIDHMLRRLDAMRYKIPYFDLRRCGLDEVGEEEFRRKLDKDKDVEGDIFFVDERTIKTASDITDKVRQHDIDIVLIDGIYRLSPSSGQLKSYDALKSVSQEVQSAAKLTEVPWVGTTQMGDSTEKWGQPKTGQEMNMGKVRGAKDLYLDASVGIGLQSNTEQKLAGIIEVHVMKSREHDKTFDENWFLANWDTDTMDFSEQFTDAPSQSFDFSVD